MAEGTSWLALQGLGDADLEANHRGKITEVQAARLRKEASLRARGILIASSFGGVGATLATAFRASRARDLLIAVPVTLGVALLVAWLVSRWVRGRIDKEIADPKVSTVDGNVERVFLAPSRNGVMMRVHGKRFHGPGLHDLARTLQIGQPVRLHVLPRNGLIVAVEPR